MTKIILNGKQTVLQPSQLIQSGGEGMVFGVNGQAVKVYHKPNAEQGVKLRYFLKTGFQLPKTVVAPTAVITNRKQQVIGYSMSLLPQGMLPLKKLGSQAYWKKQGITTKEVVLLFQQLQQELNAIHQAGLIVGDLNEQNVHFLPASSLQPAWLDVDSYQFGQFPCPVAMPAFLDPNLYGVGDFSQKPYFSQETDWYAFLLLLLKTILGVHPFGGTHTAYKSLTTRAQAGITVLDPAVTYPKLARPIELLSDELLDEMMQVLQKGVRRPLSTHLLNNYLHSLVSCSGCGLLYPRERRGCPACHHQTPVSQALGTAKLLLHVDGVIEHLSVYPTGRMAVIVRQGTLFKLVRLGLGGQINEMPLFEGGAGYRWGIFGQCVVVNPPNGRQLLILDVSDGSPQKLEMTDTGLFKGEAVFATTHTHLYRIAGNWIMQGSLVDGFYMEEPIATAHQNQTTFWAEGETLAGYHRVFAETRYFLWHAGASYDLPVAELALGESITETAVRFSAHTVAITRQIKGRGSQRADLHIFNHKGALTRMVAQWQPSYPVDAGRDPFVQPTDRVCVHPEGVVVERPSTLHFLPS